MRVAGWSARWQSGWRRLWVLVVWMGTPVEGGEEAYFHGDGDGGELV